MGTSTDRFISLFVAKFQFDHVERGDPLATIAAHGGTLAHEERVSGLVVGRSMTEHPAT